MKPSELIGDYMRKLNDRVALAKQVEQLDKEIGLLGARICNTESLASPMRGMGVITYDEKILRLKDGRVVVEDYQRPPAAWELDNEHD